MIRSIQRLLKPLHLGRRNPYRIRLDLFLGLGRTRAIVADVHRRMGDGQYWIVAGRSRVKRAGLKAGQGWGRQTLNLGLLITANVSYAIALCAMVRFSSRDYPRVSIARSIERRSRSSNDENHGCNRIVRFGSQDG